MGCGMNKPPKSDPTKDAGFQSVVQHFLKTKPKPHKEKKKAGAGKASPRPKATS
jgi:hypothetical protein